MNLNQGTNMLTEFSTTTEHCTAIITSHMASGENFEGAISMGYYPGEPEEIWLELKGTRINIQLADVDVLCKQLKRAAKLAKETK